MHKVSIRDTDIGTALHDAVDRAGTLRPAVVSRNRSSTCALLGWRVTARSHIDALDTSPALAGLFYAEIPAKASKTGGPLLENTCCPGMLSARGPMQRKLHEENIHPCWPQQLCWSRPASQRPKAKHQGTMTALARRRVPDQSPAAAADLRPAARPAPAQQQPDRAARLVRLAALTRRLVVAALAIRPRARFQRPVAPQIRPFPPPPPVSSVRLV